MEPSQMKNEIQAKINELVQVVELESNAGFQLFLDYFRQSGRDCDNAWWNFPAIDKEGFIDLKASKIAAMNVFLRLDEVKFELEQLKAELAELTEQE